jgi:hypothetical protein
LRTSRPGSYPLLALGPDVAAIIDRPPPPKQTPSPALAHLDIDQQGFALLPEDDFVNHFAADVDPVEAKEAAAAVA